MTPPDDDALIERLNDIAYGMTVERHQETLRCAADRLSALRDQLAEAQRIDLNANRFYRLMNGLDQDSHDKRAEHVMQQALDGLSIGPLNRTSTKAYLAEHFAAVAEAAEERERKLRRACESYGHKADAQSDCPICAALSEPPR